MLSDSKSVETEPNGAVDWTQATSGDFAEFDLPETVMDGIRSLGYEAPTPVQRAVIEPALAGRDLVIQSKTGSGKTAAFGIPVAARLAEPGKKPQALVLAPTRELVQQVDREVSAFVKGGGHETVVVIGGVGYGPQVDAMARGASVVVGTPGRVLDHIRKGTFDTSGIGILAVDEADEMLSMGFWEEVTAILDRLPKDRQTLLLSATLPNEIDRATTRYLRDPERLELAGDVSVVLGVENVMYYPTEGILPARNLLYVMEVERPRSALVFCNTKAESAGVAVYLRRFGYRVDAIHGDLSQRERERAMGRLRSGDVDVLVATDIAARGIDISDLSHVFNYGLPEQPEVYVHRVGRTGRIGRRGTAITLLSGRDAGTMSAVQKRYGVQFERRTLPDEQEINRMQSERLIEQLMEASEDVEFEMYVPVAKALTETEEGRRAVGFLLREYFAMLEKRTAGSSKPSPGASSRGPATTRLYVGVGEDEATEEELRELLADVDGVEAGDIFSVSRKATSAFVEVEPGAARKLADAELVLDDRTVRIEVARSQGGRGGGGGRRGGGRDDRRGGGGRGGYGGGRGDRRGGRGGRGR